jgi:homocysteine S-methyltransferase
MTFVTLMEGSFGSHLRKYVGDRLDGDPLWSARILATDREKCIFTHRDLVKGLLCTREYLKPFFLNRSV